MKKDLGQVLLALEELQDEAIREALEPKTKPVDAERSGAQAKRSSCCARPDLARPHPRGLRRAAGVVGEETNKLIGYLAAVSRKLEEPLAVIVQSSSSAAGKSSLMDAVLSLVPEEDRVQYSAMTGQSLFYMGETRSAPQGAGDRRRRRRARRRATRSSCSRARGSSRSPRPARTRRPDDCSTQEYQVEGPVMIFLTTTAIEIDEELLNRCLVLTVDEGREQTRAIHRLQRARGARSRVCSGEARAARGSGAAPERAASARGRSPCVNPFAEKLTFLDEQTRTRRDHEKYLTLIDAIALLHQHQREVKTLGATAAKGCATSRSNPEDIELANRLMAEVLGHSLDELPPQTRRFLELLDRSLDTIGQREGLKRPEILFRRRDVREWTGWSYAQVRSHLERLVEMEYVLVHRRGRGQSLVYELVWEGQGQGGERFVLGLLDSGQVDGDVGTTATLRGETEEFDPPLTPVCPPFEGGLRSAEAATQPPRNGHDHGSGISEATNAPPGASKLDSSYRRLSSAVTSAGSFERAGRGVPRVSGSEGVLAENPEDGLLLSAALCHLVRRARNRVAARRHPPHPRALPALALPLSPEEREAAELSHAAPAPGPPQGLLRLARARAPPGLQSGHRARAAEVLAAPPDGGAHRRGDGAAAARARHDDRLGLRDRAMLETFYSTGIRRMELIGLDLYDLDTERGWVTIRSGKGGRDRVIPIGTRALAWVEKYLEDVRPSLVLDAGETALFLSGQGRRFAAEGLSHQIRALLDEAGITKRGSCHLLRHTMATQMLENGADIRYIQEMLGHAKLETTQLYTQVSIHQLKKIHDATHPARLERTSELARQLLLDIDD